VEGYVFDTVSREYVLMGTHTISESTPVQLTPLVEGQYRFLEVNLPQGIEPLENPIDVTITDPAAVVEITFTNQVRFGCTLGYWKNHVDAWPAGYSPDDTLSTAGFVYASLDSELLKDALKFKGGKGLDGGARILLRQSVAALLNEAAFGADYPPYGTTGDLIAAVNGALASTDRETMTMLAEELDLSNNGYCPDLQAGDDTT